MKDELSNMRTGISLEIGTTTGAIAGSLTLLALERLNLLYAISIIFGCVLRFSTFPNFVKMRQEAPYGCVLLGIRTTSQL